MSLIQNKFCGLCRVELTPTEFYEIISIPLYGAIQEVHIQCVDKFADDIKKEQMQIFDQETFKQLEKEKKEAELKNESLKNEVQNYLNQNVDLLGKNRELLEKYKQFRIFNQFIVDHYEIIGVIRNLKKQQGQLTFFHAEYDSQIKRRQIIIDGKRFDWSSSYLIHNVEVQSVLKNENTDNVNHFTFRFGFINRLTNKSRFILEYNKEKETIETLSQFDNYTKISFGNLGYTWFNSAKYYPIIEVLYNEPISGFEVKLDYEEFLDLSFFRSENPDLFKKKKRKISIIKNWFSRKEKT